MPTKKQTLKVMRLSKRLTQGEVAAKMDVSQAYFSAVERGLKPREVSEAMLVINGMRPRGDRTDGGKLKAGRKKG